jgi:hypothetical protein
MAEEVACRPIAVRSTADKTSDPARIAEQLAEALRQGGFECVVTLPKVN